MAQPGAGAHSAYAVGARLPTANGTGTGGGTRSHESRTVEVSDIPLKGVEGLDRTTLMNVAKIMLTLHYPKISVQKWDVEREDAHYNIVVHFPKLTPFDDAQIDRVKLVNEYSVKRVWVQPEADRVLLCASVRPSDADSDVTITELRIVERRVSDANRKRRRTEV